MGIVPPDFLWDRELTKNARHIIHDTLTSVQKCTASLATSTWTQLLLVVLELGRCMHYSNRVILRDKTICLQST